MQDMRIAGCSAIMLYDSVAACPRSARMRAWCDARAAYLSGSAPVPKR